MADRPAFSKVTPEGKGTGGDNGVDTLGGCRLVLLRNRGHNRLGGCWLHLGAQGPSWRFCADLSCLTCLGLRTFSCPP